MSNKIFANSPSDWPNYKIETAVGHHFFVQDEPLDQGGLNQGPSPFETMMLSLASCTLITLRMYLERKLKINSEGKETGLATMPGLRLEISYQTDEKDIKILKVSRKISVDYIEPDQIDLNRLLLVANKCPVHNMLAPVMTIETEIDFQ